MLCRPPLAIATYLSKCWVVISRTIENLNASFHIFIFSGKMLKIMYCSRCTYWCTCVVIVLVKVIVIIIYYPSQPLVIRDQMKYAFTEMFVDDAVIDLIDCMKISWGTDC